MVEFLVFALIESVADLLHKLVIEIKVMKNAKTHSERFLSLKEMSYIRARVILAGRTAASL